DDDEVDFGIRRVSLQCRSPGLAARGRQGVVIAEGRGVLERVIPADQGPADSAVIAAVYGIREEARDRVHAHELEERRLLDRREQLDLVVGGERREAACTRDELLRLRGELLEALAVILLPVALERHESAVDERDDVRLACARRAV